MNQFPEDPVPLEPPSRIDERRRRRTRRLVVPSGKAEQSIYINDLATRFVPGMDFYFLSALCGLVLAVAFLLDHPAVYVLAALVAPLMLPLIGLSFSTAVGSIKFFVRSLGGFIVGAAFVFIFGLISGGFSKILPDFAPTQINYFTTFTFADLVLVVVGTLLAVILTIKTPKQRSLIASAALAYEVLLPIGAAGFGLANGNNTFLFSTLRHSGIAFLSVMIIGFVTLLFMRLRPATLFGTFLTLIILGSAIFLLIRSSAMDDVVKQFSTYGSQTMTTMPANSSETVYIAVTETPRPPAPTIPVPKDATPTNTLVPTRTPTVTNTPKPPEIWATINSETGIYMRLQPCYDDTNCPKVIPAIANHTPVLVLGTNAEKNWYMIRLDNGSEGWVNQMYLSFNQ